MQRIVILETNGAFQRQQPLPVSSALVGDREFALVGSPIIMEKLLKVDNPLACRYFAQIRLPFFFRISGRVSDVGEIALHEHSLRLVYIMEKKGHTGAALMSSSVVSPL